MEEQISFFGQFFSIFANVFYHTWWFVLPPTFYHIFLVLHEDYVYAYSDKSFLSRLKWIMLEITPPSDIERGPKMMESIFQGLSGVTTSSNTFAKKLDGGLGIQDRFSLELVSDEGKVRYFIRTQKKHRNMIEALVYAQYPDAQIVETDDYAKRFPLIIPNREWEAWGTDFEFMQPSIYPIKTYDKFEEDITGEMIDPMASIIEVMGALGPGQQSWLQFVIEPLQEKWNAEKKQKDIVDKLKGKEEPDKKGLGGHLLDVIVNIPSGILGGLEFKSEEKKEQQPLEFRLSPVEKEILKSVEENIGRYTYKTKMRFLHLSKRSLFNKSHVSAMVGSIKQFNDMNYNSLRPNDVSKTYGKIFLKQRTADMRKRKIYDRYRSRNMDDAKVMLSSKELATLFHFPDIGVKSPALSRTTSKLGAAPQNLPVM